MVVEDGGAIRAAQGFVHDTGWSGSKVFSGSSGVFPSAACGAKALKRPTHESSEVCADVVQ
jgi:hypothetical protein